MATKEKNRPKKPKTTKSKVKEAKIEKNDERFKDRWSLLNNEVHSALCYWNDLTEKYNGKISRDEEQLHEIKSLLKELQTKIKVFNDL